MLIPRAVAAANTAIAGDPLSASAIRAHLAGRTWHEFSAAERALALANFHADPGLAPSSVGPDVPGAAAVQAWLFAYEQAAQAGR